MIRQALLDTDYQAECKLLFCVYFCYRRFLHFLWLFKFLWIINSSDSPRKHGYCLLCIVGLFIYPSAGKFLNFSSSFEYVLRAIKILFVIYRGNFVFVCCSGGLKLLNDIKHQAIKLMLLSIKPKCIYFSSLIKP